MHSDKWSLQMWWTWSLHFFWKSFLISMHLDGEGKRKFIEFQRHSHMFWVLRYFHLTFHTPLGMLARRRWNLFSNFVKILWLYMSIYFFHSSRLSLRFLGDMNKALAWRWYWMTEPPGYANASVQIDRYRTPQNFCG